MRTLSKYEPTHTNVLESPRVAVDRSPSRQTPPPRAIDLRVRVARDHHLRIASRVSERLTHAASTSARRHSSRDGSTPSRGASPCFRLDARETARDRAIPRVVNARWTRRRVAAFGTSARAIGRRGGGRRRRRAGRAAIARDERRRGRLDTRSLRMSIAGFHRVDVMGERMGRRCARREETGRSTRG